MVRLKWLSVGVVLPVLIVGGWIALYPGSDDPKSLQYVLWKHGLYQTDPGNIVFAFEHDSARNDLVVGRGEAELRDRFGFLVRREDAPEFLRRCLKESGWENEDIRFIRDTRLFVVFENGRATKIVHAKPC